MSDDERRVPEGRIGRLARLAAVGMRAGRSMLSRGDGDVRDAAKYAGEVIGTMRGLAAKAGQMASYVDGVVPKEHRELYEQGMKMLRDAAPRSTPEEIRALVEEELGAPIDRLFARFDERAFASASIGQVHDAELPDGRRVAVKVQHPGVARAVESDLANAGLLTGLLGPLAGRRFDTKGSLAVVRARFREELDYANEAENIAHFASLHADDPTIRILEVVPERSSRRVLTTLFVEGRSFDAACEASEEKRRAWIETMWRFVFRGNLVGAKFNADPHPGNYVFGEGGVVHFLDFGCVQAIPAGDLANARRIHFAAIDRDRGGVEHASRALIGMAPGKLADMSVAYMFECFEPLLESPYRITRAYAASLVDGFKEMALYARKCPKEEFFDMPPEMIFMNRLQFGFYSVLARLDAEVDYAAVERAFADEMSPDRG